MDILTNFIETSYPDTRHQFLQIDETDDIIIGGTCTHVFRLPFKYSTYAKSLSIYYKQGLSIILERTQDDVTLDETTEENNTIVTVTLNPLDTTLFTDTLLDTFVQLKIINVNNEVIYDEPHKIIVKTTLDN